MQEYITQAGKAQSMAVQQERQVSQYVENDGLQGQASYHYMAVPTQYSDMPGQASQYMPGLQNTGIAQGVLSLLMNFT